MSTRYTNAVANNTFEAPFTFKKEDGTEGISVPPHVSTALKHIKHYEKRQFTHKFPVCGPRKR
jgi:hypothetical protein